MSRPTRSVRSAVAAVLFALAPAAAAQLPCRLRTPRCPAIAACLPPSPGPCAAPSAMAHLQANPCAGGGSFDLTGTQYELTCHGGIVGACPPHSGVVPPIRHWAIGNGFDFAQANSGCPDLLARQWLVNAGLDLGIARVVGHWIGFQADWSWPGVNGCPLHPARGWATHTVSEIADVLAASEGTVDHASWYLIAAAPRPGGGTTSTG